MYVTSIGFLAVEYAFIDVFHITVTNFDGQVLTGAFVQTQMHMSTLNTVTADIINGTYVPTNGTFYDRVETVTTAAAAISWNLFTILTGLYIFNLVLFLGVPLVFVIGLAIAYSIMFGLTAVEIIRGV